jgi:hypothetical protein
MNQEGQKETRKEEIEGGSLYRRNRTVREHPVAVLKLLAQETSQ